MTRSKAFSLLTVAPSVLQQISQRKLVPHVYIGNCPTSQNSFYIQTDCYLFVLYQLRLRLSLADYWHFAFKVMVDLATLPK